jgi:hypothetical protein
MHETEHPRAVRAQLLSDVESGHRHAEDQHLTLGVDSASPGLVAGPLPAGTSTLTLSANMSASDQCDIEIQIGAETTTSPTLSSRSSACCSAPPTILQRERHHRRL